MEKEIQETKQKRQIEPAEEEKERLNQDQTEGTKLPTEASVEPVPSRTPTKIEEQKPEVEAVKTKEETVVASEQEKQFLLVLDLIHQNKSGLRVTGFQVKDFLELVFPGQDIDSTYSSLKSKQFVSSGKDSDEFWLSYKGSEETKKHKELLSPLLERVAKIAVESLGRNELLERLLYLSYLNKWRIQSYYFPKVSEGLAETDRILATFFFSDDFQKLPEIEKAVRYLRKRQPSLVKEKLEELCRDPDFLKALTVLELPQIIERLRIGVAASIYYRDYTGNLSLFLQDETRDRVVKDLMLLGITESDNLFGADIKAVLAKEENTSRIREWLTFARDEFRRMGGDDWDMFLDTKKCVEGSAPSNILKFAKSSALLISKDKLLVRKELKEIYEEVRQSLENVLNERVKDCRNVTIMPFYQREKLKDLEGKIVVTVQAGDWLISEDELVSNIVLKISPLEVGFKAVKPEELKNKEFNAIGAFSNLEEAKARFGLCEWVSEDENSSVKRAKEIIEDRKTPRISLDEAIEQLKAGIAIEGVTVEGSILIEALIAAINKPTNYTAIFKRKKFTKRDVWAVIQQTLGSRHQLSDKELTLIEKVITEVVEKQARVDLLTLESLGEGTTDSGKYYSRETNLLFKVFELCKDVILSSIENQLAKFDQHQKEILWVYLSYFRGSQLNLDLSRFNQIYTLIFGGKETIRLKEVTDTINKSGFSVAEPVSEDHIIESPYPFLQEDVVRRFIDRLENDIGAKSPDLSIFIREYRHNTIELIGLDYILASGGFVKRDNLRDFLWKVSLEAWNKFEPVQGIVSPKEEETILVNPSLVAEVTEFLNAKKKELLEGTEILRDLILSLENIDRTLDFNEKLGVYQGCIITLAKEEIKILITPWYMPYHEALLGKKNIVVLTNQPDYETFVKSFQERKETLLVFVEGQDFSVYSTFSHTSIVDSLVSKLENSFRLKTKEIKKEKPSEEPSLGQAKVIEEKERIAIPKVEAKEEDVSGESSGGGEELQLFGEIFNSSQVDFPAGLYSEDRPVVIILSQFADDDYHSSIFRICKEIYRERVGGLPTPSIMDKHEDFTGESLSAGKRLLLIEDPYETIEATDKEWGKLGNRLREMDSQSFGLIVLHILDAKKEKLRKELEAVTKTLTPSIIELSPKKWIMKDNLEFVRVDAKAKRKMASVLWGWVIPKNSPGWQSGKTFDDFFAACYDRFYERLRSILSPDAKIGDVHAYVIVKPQGLEDDLHRAIKIFVVKYLVEKEKYTRDSIKVEEEDATVAKKIPDIKVGNIAIEVETLYGTGKPWDKIYGSVQKYKDTDDEVWLVLKNLDVFFFYRHLKELQIVAKKELKVNVKFLTLDLENQQLVSIEKMREVLRLGGGKGVSDLKRG